MVNFANFHDHEYKNMLSDSLAVIGSNRHDRKIMAKSVKYEKLYI